MKVMQTKLIVTFLLFTFTLFSQNKITVSGKIVEKTTNEPLEYATVILQNASKTDEISGGITDENGNFKIDVKPGTYNVRFEYISFKTVSQPNKVINANTNFGTIALTESADELDEIVVIAEKSTVEFKLDKKIYNVGKDMMVKGGNASDVLNNVPSVTVDAEGTVSLRGNEDVRILIDGKPSGLAGINISDALRMLPADAVEKVEVVTNPSARYEAEGGGGIINIILRKGKNEGFNGVINANTGYPDNHGVTATINYKTKKYNIFTTQGTSHRRSPGFYKFDSEFLNNLNQPTGYSYEYRDIERKNKNYNGIVGFEYFISDKTTFTNTLTYSKSNEITDENVSFTDLDANANLIQNRYRNNDSDNDGTNFELAANITHLIDGYDHKINFDASISSNSDETDTFTTINGLNYQQVFNPQDVKRSVLIFDYINQKKENFSYEMGYRGNFNKNTNDFEVQNYDNNQWNIDYNFTNIFKYNEYVNAFYAQAGTKWNKLSILGGIRWEDSNILVAEILSNQSERKKYNNFFPSLFFNYEATEKSSFALNYSRRIRRPRGRMLNPFSNISSNVNIFRGNPDLDPSMTHAIDLSFLYKRDKLTVSSSTYLNYTEDSFNMIRRESGIINEEGNQIFYTGPVNIGTEKRFGFEVTTNYSPYKWLRFNYNFNLFNVETNGIFNYVDANNISKSINLDNKANSWSTRLNSRVVLPKNIEWQTNISYNGPQNNAQGKSYGIASANLSLSKDILKEKGTLALNVSDLFNSRKRIYDANIPGVLNSYSEILWRERQITLSFTYRFNRNKNDRDKQRREDNTGEGDFMG